uniref:Uncharacterized protein n=1 Tax=Oryza rufipogon TaxID=4529 RepID=A0A0E0R679_ORYRU
MSTSLSAIPSPFPLFTESYFFTSSSVNVLVAPVLHQRFLRIHDLDPLVSPSPNGIQTFRKRLLAKFAVLLNIGADLILFRQWQMVVTITADLIVFSQW